MKYMQQLVMILVLSSVTPMIFSYSKRTLKHYKKWGVLPEPEKIFGLTSKKLKARALDLSKADLSGRTLRGNLSNANFEGANLKNCTIVHEEGLQNAGISGANFKHANFSGAKIRTNKKKLLKGSTPPFSVRALTKKDLKSFGALNVDTVKGID